MIRLIVSILVALVLFSAPIFLHWASGYEIERSPAIAGKLIVSMLLFCAGLVLSYACPLWGEK